MDMKRCTKCGEEFPATKEFFSSDAQKRDGLRPDCKSCNSNSKAKQRLINRDKINQKARDKRREDIEKSRARDRDYYHKNKPRIRVYYKKRRTDNIDEFRNKEADYRENNRDRINRKTRERRSKDREEVNRQNKEYRDKNPERYRASQRKHYAKNRDQILLDCRQYVLKNPWIGRAAKQRYSARKRGLPDTLTKDQCKRAVEYFENKCVYCGKELSVVTLDHYIPVSDPDCPGTIASNMLPACFTCNASKQDTDVRIWLLRSYDKEMTDSIIRRIEAYFASLGE